MNTKALIGLLIALFGMAMFCFGVAEEEAEYKDQEKIDEQKRWDEWRSKNRQN